MIATSAFVGIATSLTCELSVSASGLSSAVCCLRFPATTTAAAGGSLEDRVVTVLVDLMDMLQKRNLTLKQREAQSSFFLLWTPL